MRHGRSLAVLAAMLATAPALIGAQPALAKAPPAKARAAEHASKMQRVPLSIATARGVRRFIVEVARSGDEQERGLMFRTKVPAGTGMLFPMSPPRPAGFWMKNTLVPLDMIFIRADGTIARIAANTVPQTLDVVDSGEPVAAVLELAGGAAAAQGIAANDRVRWSGRANR
jgi:uncharacterized membrane protein (UPF0127 family)